MAKPAFVGVVQVYVASAAGVLVLLLGCGVIAYGDRSSRSAALIPLVAMRRAWCGRYVRGTGHLDLAVWQCVSCGPGSR